MISEGLNEAERIAEGFHETRALEYLERLGLSRAEAEVFLYLLLSPGTTTVISEACGLSRMNTYRVLYNLEKKGLVIESAGHPKGYVAVSIPDAVRILKSYWSIRVMALTKVQDMLLGMPGKERTDSLVEGTGQGSFSILTGRRSIESRLQSVIGNAKGEIDVTVTAERASLLQFAIADEDSIGYDTKQSPNCRPRLVLYANNLQADSLQAFSKFFIRLSSASPEFSLMVCDKIQCILDITDQNAHKLTALWTDCRPLVLLVKNRFEALWSEGIEPLDYKQ